MTACSRGPRYSGKLIARAIELYLNGVKPGYIRWHELQNTLQKEFPREFPVMADDLPSPETVLDWVRKFPDAPERIKQLKAQEVAQGKTVSGAWSYTYCQSELPAMAPYTGMTNTNVSTLFSQCIALMALAMMARFLYCLVRA